MLNTISNNNINPFKQNDFYKNKNIKFGSLSFRDVDYPFFKKSIKRELYLKYTPDNNDFWAYFTPQDTQHCPWKMHIYATTPNEWEDVGKAILPYLQKNNILHKTLSTLKNFKTLNENNQKGKAFVIYPKDKNHFKEIAKYLDSKIKENNLQIKTSNIEGDKKLGNTGRIFYRYEGTSKSNPAYDPNRGSNHYMPADMTEKDDPFLNLNI